MSTPFLALAPQHPRIVDVPYVAPLLICVDVTDLTDLTDLTDVTDGGGGDVMI